MLVFLNVKKYNHYIELYTFLQPFIKFDMFFCLYARIKKNSFSYFRLLKLSDLYELCYLYINLPNYLLDLK